MHETTAFEKGWEPVDLGPYRKANMETLMKNIPGAIHKEIKKALRRPDGSDLDGDGCQYSGPIVNNLWTAYPTLAPMKDLDPKRILAFAYEARLG